MPVLSHSYAHFNYRPGNVTRSGTQLLLDGQPYRFLGFNLWRAAVTSWNKPGNTGYLGNDYLGATLDHILAYAPHVNAFRAWFIQQFAVDQGNGSARRWDALDKVLTEAGSRGMKVVACLQDQYDYERQNNGTGDLGKTWYDTGYSGTVLSPYETVTYRAWADEVTRRYAGDARILCWEFMNEADVAGGGTCLSGSDTSFQAWAADIAGLCKANDPARLTCVGQLGWGQCGYDTAARWHAVNAIADVDMATWHDYISAQPTRVHGDQNPGGTVTRSGDEWNGLDSRAADAASLGKPIFVGECGIHLTSDILVAYPGATQAEQISHRADWLDAKLAAQFGNYPNLAGHLSWHWKELNAGTADYGDGYNYSTADAALPVLDSYALLGAEGGGARGDPVPRPGGFRQRRHHRRVLDDHDAAVRVAAG